jgi:hypothetical protein
MSFNCLPNAPCMSPKCSINSVYLSLLSTYTYFRDHIEIWAHSVASTSLQQAGMDETSFSCLKSKQKRSYNEQDTMYPRDDCADCCSSEWALTSGHGINGKCGFKPPCRFRQFCTRGREVDRVRCQAQLALFYD